MVMGTWAPGGAARRAVHGAPVYELMLLGGFQLRCGGEVVDTIRSCERVLAFLALNDRSLPRADVAASLWPETTDEKANANLRTALWRLNRFGKHVLDSSDARLSLGAQVWVDVRWVQAAAQEFRATGVLPAAEFIDRMRGELLPGFWDSWLVFERERLRQEMIHLGEVICRDAIERGATHLAVLAALGAVECDPLRESSTSLLVEAHLAAGNGAEAVCAYRRYAELLASELDSQPGAELTSRSMSGLTPLRHHTEGVLTCLRTAAGGTPHPAGTHRRMAHRRTRHRP